MGGTAVVVGLPPAGVRATFDPGTLVAMGQRILGPNYGGIDPARDIPWLVDEYLAGDLLLDELATGATLRQLLIP